MSRASVLGHGRGAARAGMVDACIIRRVTGSATDPQTGAVTKVRAVVYDGPCRVQVLSQMATSGRDIGDQDIAQLWLIVQLPITGTAGIRERDDVEITTARHDPDVVGRDLIVHEAHHKTHATARRIGVRERTSEE